MGMALKDIRLGRDITLTGRVVTMDASNGLSGDDPRFELLPTGEARITLHIRLADQDAGSTELEENQ